MPKPWKKKQRGKSVEQPVVNLAETYIAIAESNPDTPELDLHEMSVEEAKRAVDVFLDRAFVAGDHAVKIIHGIGTGKLAREMPKFLRQHPHVEKIKVGAQSGTAIYIAIKEN